MYSITDETKTALKDLDQDVTLYYIVQKGSEDDTIEKLLEHYDELSDHIKVETKTRICIRNLRVSIPIRR